MSHGTARRWFLDHKSVPFATCPMTEAGFVRISMNPLVVGQPISLGSALALLHEYKIRYPHQFWPESLSAPEALGSFDRLTGHRQVTDAYLLSLAAAQQGTLVTLDSAIASWAPAALAPHLLVVS